MFRNRVSWSLLFGLVACLSHLERVEAIGIPTFENFTLDNAQWGLASTPSSNYIASTWVAGGGPAGAGDAYTQGLITLTSSTSAQTVFRGQDNFNSSGDAFIGQWTTTGRGEFSYWVRHNAATPLVMGARFASSANSPGASILNQTPVPPNQWTQVWVPINNAAVPGITYIPEVGSFTTVFNNIGNVQVVAERGSLATGTQVLFELDQIAYIPEPSTWAMATIGLGMIVGGAYRRRQKSGTVKQS